MLTYNKLEQKWQKLQHVSDFQNKAKPRNVFGNIHNTVHRGKKYTDMGFDTYPQELNGTDL
jgi:hypothetical protein